MASSNSRVSRRFKFFAVVVVLCLAAIVAYALYVGGAFAQPPHIAFVVGGKDPYFEIAAAGARDAADYLGARVEVLVPADTPGSEDQDRILRDLISRRVDGIAISPMNPRRQAVLLREAAAKTHLVTFDADAPVCQRLCYIGTDNYSAGRLCGKLVREALPDGGKVILSVGDLSADNGQRRRQGVIDELLDRSYEPSRPHEAIEPVLAGPKYTILGTLIDKDSRQSARETVLGAVKAYPDVAGLIGLYAYNGPAIIDALKDAGRLGQIKVVAFDYDGDTLAGIEAGHVFGSVVQDPYDYGYRAVSTLVQLSRGEQLALPMFETLMFDCRIVRQDEVAELRATLKQRLQRAKASG